MHGIEFLPLPDIGTDSDDLAVVIVFLQPRDDDRRIKTAGICQNYFFDLLCHV